MKRMEFRIKENDITIECLYASSKKWIMMGIIIVFVLIGIFVADQLAEGALLQNCKKRLTNI